MDKPFRHKLWLKIVIGMFLGISIGLLVSPDGAAIISTKSANVFAVWFALPGHIFLALIQMIMIPLIVSSIILGIAETHSLSKLRSIGFRITPYFIITTLISITIGTILASLIKPGQYIDKNLLQSSIEQETVSNVGKIIEAPSFHDRIVNLIPTNPIDAALNGNMLQLVILAIFVGIALTAIKSLHSKPLVALAKSIQELSMVIVGWAMRLAPIAVMGLLAQVTIKVGITALLGMSVYVATVLLGLISLLSFYLIIIWLIGGVNPLVFLSKIKEIQLLAFSTSSSAAVMPLSIQTAEEKLEVQSSTANFIIPLGATINMDGTAIYQVIAAIFITQVFGVDLSLGELFLLAITTLGASIGTPSTPGVGIIVLATVLTGIGIPASGIALIIGVDRILDMSRTVINVTGDLTACVIMDKWLKKTKSR